MLQWLKQLDGILRGEATRPADLSERGVPLSLGGLSLVCLILAMIYGACMGSFALFRVVENPELVGGYHRSMQLLASTVKVPALFLLTLIVTFPSLYVFNALVGSRLSIVALLKLLIAGLGVNLAVLASLGPIVAFFSVSTTGYSFMVLLNVAVLGASGVLGLSFLLQTLHRMSFLPSSPTLDEHAPASGPHEDTSNGSEAPGNVPPPPVPDRIPAYGKAAERDPGAANAETPGDGFSLEEKAEGKTEEPPVPAKLLDQPGALDWLGEKLLGDHVRTVFYCWIVLFGLVGTQMGWVLRPFIGSPDKPFTWFRARGSNFFEAVWHNFLNLFS